ELFSNELEGAGQFGPGRLHHERHAVVAGFDHRGEVVGNLPGDLAADRFERLIEADLRVFESHAVDHNADLVGEPLDVLEVLHESHHVAQAGQVELGHQEHVVGGLHGGHVERAETFGDI